MGALTGLKAVRPHRGPCLECQGQGEVWLRGVGLSWRVQARGGASPRQELLECAARCAGLVLTELTDGELACAGCRP